MRIGYFVQIISFIVFLSTPFSSSVLAGPAEATNGKNAMDRSSVPVKARKRADKLLRRLARSSQGRVKAQAALALCSFHDDPAVVEGLLNALSDKRAMVRSSAARALVSVAPFETFSELCAAGRDENNTFARTWIQKAVLHAAGQAPTIMVNVDDIGGGNHSMGGQVGRKLKSAFLEKLFEYRGYTLGISFDFSEDGSGSGEEDIRLSLVGDFVFTGDKKLASATLDVRAVAADGFILWNVLLEAVDVPQGMAPEVNDPFADEYTIHEEGEDARLVAAGELAFKAAIRLNEVLKGVQ